MKTDKRNRSMHTHCRKQQTRPHLALTTPPTHLPPACSCNLVARGNRSLYLVAWLASYRGACKYVHAALYEDLALLYYTLHTWARILE